MLAALLACALRAGAQATVEAETDSLQIFIGEQTALHLRVTAREGARIAWPALKARQYLVPGLEITDVDTPDTTRTGDGQVVVSRDYTLTSFDERLYAIPALTLRVDGKPYATPQLALKVITVDVDTLHPNQFFPPKGVQSNPFDWGEWAPLLWLSLLVIVLAALSLWLYSRLRTGKPVVVKIRIVRHIPPHQRAMSEIDRIKAEHLQLSEDQKTYYTRLTDTIRKYINERFGFNATEMTSEEIIARLAATADRTMTDELSSLLRTADLVKFARHSTLISERDQNLLYAVDFIGQTKQDTVPTEEKIVPRMTEAERRTRSTRIVLRTVIALAALAAVAMVVYVVYSAYQILS